MTVTTPVAHPARPLDDRRGGDRTLALLLAALSAAIATNSLLGPLLADAIDYRLSVTMRNQLIGLDAVSLALVVPLCLVAAVLVWRGRASGTVLAVGPATYAAYMFVQYVVGPSYLTYPRALPLHLGIFVLSGITAARAVASVRAEDLPALSSGQRSTRMWVMFALSAFVVSRYLPALVGSATGAALTAELAADPAFFWVILLMDLGVVVPVTVATGLALRRGAPRAALMHYAVVGWFALVPPSVAAMAAAMLLNDDPYASAANTAMFTVTAVACAVLAVRTYLPVLRQDGA
jgi:hypothetical protein